MAQKHKFSTLFVAVLAGLPAVVLLGSQTAHAQYRVNNGDGHANDVNPRIGGGGYNTQTSSSPYANTNVLTGNVSGLNYFHGNSQTFDPSVFQGRTGTGPSDRLNALAAPVNYAAPSTGAPNYTTYYNNTKLAAPPPGNYVPAPNGQGQVPAPAVNSLVPSSDTRLQNDLSVNPTDQTLPTPGELNVVGPLDPSGSASSLYSMSPLYGVRAQQGNNPDDNSFLSKTTENRLSTPADRMRSDPASIQKMRDELNKTMLPDDQAAKDNVTPGAIDVNASNQLPADNTPAAGMLSGAKPLSNAVDGQQVQTSMSSGESVQSTLVISPSKQSKQLADLEKKYAKSTEKLTDVQATDRFNQQVLAQSKAPLDGADKKTAKPVTGAAGGPTDIADGSIPANSGKPAAPALKPVLTGPKNQATEQPYIVTSLATGIQAKGLANLLKSGEDQMRQGKFTEAVASYETAEAVAPNNPYVFLGRGFAELGASYYGRSEQDMEHAIISEPAILVGKYDLKGFLGEDRLAFIQKDLQDIADHEKGARPFVLLAFITHNNGDDSATARNLSDARTRGGYGKLVDLMTSAWEIKPAAK